MNIVKMALQDVLLIEPKTFDDQRGYFFESFQKERYEAIGLPTFVQDNVSRSKKNVVRGLHYQLERPQGKLVYVTKGAVMDVVVDIRKSSPTFGEAISIELNDQNHYQLYIPPGFAHGFCVLSEEADFIYKCTDYYYPAGERGILWNDPSLGIIWPVATPLVSSKDTIYPLLAEVANNELPL